MIAYPSCDRIKRNVRDSVSMNKLGSLSHVNNEMTNSLPCQSIQSVYAEVQKCPLSDKDIHRLA